MERLWESLEHLEPCSFFWEEPVPVSSSVALCEVIKLPMPAVFVCTRYELMVIPVRWNVTVIRLLREMSLIAPCVNFPEHFSRLQTPHLIAPSWPNDGLQFHFLFCDLFFGFIPLPVNCYCEDSAAKGDQTSILYWGAVPWRHKKWWLILI